jgi:hypothetical protein
MEEQIQQTILMFHAIIRVLNKNVPQLLLQTASLDMDKSNRNEPVKLILKNYYLLLNSSLKIQINMRARRQPIQCVSTFLPLYAAHTVRRVLPAIACIYSLYNACVPSCHYMQRIQCVSSFLLLYATYTVRELLPAIICNVYSAWAPSNCT